MTGFVQDVRFALRQMVRHPALTVVASITLALAIGANTAIFSVVKTVLVDSAPYPHVDRLAMIWGRNQARGDELSNSPGDFNSWKQENRVFEDLAASYDIEPTLTGSGEPRLVIGYAVTPNYFGILGVPPAVGRNFSEQEAQSHASVAVFSDKFWRAVFHGDPQIVGKALTLDGKAYTVIGVMPPTFNYPPRTELWTPISASEFSTDFDHRFLRVLGRLKPGVSMANAQVQMDTLQRRVASLHPQTDAGNVTVVEPLRQQLTGDIRTPLLALFGAVGFVLLVACVNIASLLLARAAGRKAEVSLRAAIGATQFRIVRQFLIESCLLAVPGGILGVILALWCTRFLVTIFPNNVANLSIPRVESIPVDAAVLTFTFGITLLSALLFGILPALQARRMNSSEVLKDSGRVVGTSARLTGSRRALTVAEVALSLILLVVAGLMVESFRHVLSGNLGFQPDHVLGLEVFLPRNRYEAPEKQTAFLDSALRNLQKVPGVQSAAATNYLPLTGFWGETDFQIQGQESPDAANRPHSDNRLASPGYFATMGIRLLKGREFSVADRQGSERVAIINAALAHHYFGNAEPIDKVLLLGDAGHLEKWRIVGVAGDVKAFGPEEAVHADVYRPIAQVPSILVGFVVQTAMDPVMLLKPAEQAIWDVDKDQPVFDAMPISMLAEQSMAVRRTSTIVLTSFAVLALILAAIGLYGVMAYSVSQRTHEIGVRMALGAKHRDVVRLTLHSGLRLVVIGEAIGLVAALAVTRLLSSLWFGVAPNNPMTLLLAFGVLTLSAFAASWIPARRAAKVDPAVSLRYE